MNVGAFADAAAQAVNNLTIPFVYAVPLLDRQNRTFHTLAGIVSIIPSPHVVAADGRVIVPLPFDAARFVDDSSGRPLRPAPVHVLKTAAEIKSEIEMTWEYGLPMSMIGGFCLRLPEVVEDGFELEQIPALVTSDGFIEAVKARPAFVTFRVSRDGEHRVVSVRAVRDAFADVDLTPVWASA